MTTRRIAILLAAILLATAAILLAFARSRLDDRVIGQDALGQIGRDAAGPWKVVLVGAIGFGAEEEELEGPLETRCLVAIFDAHAL